MFGKYGGRIHRWLRRGYQTRHCEYCLDSLFTTADFGVSHTHSGCVALEESVMVCVQRSAFQWLGGSLSVGLTHLPPRSLAWDSDRWGLAPSSHDGADCIQFLTQIPHL